MPQTLSSPRLAPSTVTRQLRLGPRRAGPSTLLGVTSGREHLSREHPHAFRRARRRAATLDRGRERGRRARRPPALRGHRDLPDHPVLAHGRAGGRVVGDRPPEPVGSRAERGRDAERRRRRRGVARRAADRSARHHVHGVAGTAAHAPRHVQDRRRAHAVRDARGSSNHRHARAVDLRRSQRRDGGADDRVRDARVVVRAGGAGPGAGRARRDPGGARAVPALLRRVPDLAPGRQDRDASGRRSASHDRRPVGPGAPGSGAHPRPPGPPRHGAEPRRVLPGAGGGQPLLPGPPRPRAGGDGPAGRADGPAVPALRLRGASAGRARPGADGLRVRRGRGGRRDARGSRRARRPGEGPALPAVLGGGARGRHADHRPSRGRPRPHQGAGGAR